MDELKIYYEGHDVYILINNNTSFTKYKLKKDEQYIDINGSVFPVGTVRMLRDYLSEEQGGQLERKIDKIEIDLINKKVFFKINNFIYEYKMLYVSNVATRPSPRTIVIKTDTTLNKTTKLNSRRKFSCTRTKAYMGKRSKIIERGN